MPNPRGGKNRFRHCLACEKRLGYMETGMRLEESQGHRTSKQKLKGWLCWQCADALEEALKKMKAAS